jgi:hypothetical protein
VAGQNHGCHHPSAEGRTTDERRQQADGGTEQQRKHERMRCAAMTPFVFVSDAKPEADYIGVW